LADKEQKGLGSPRPPNSWPVEGGLSRLLLRVQHGFMGMHSIGGLRLETDFRYKLLLGNHLRYTGAAAIRRPPAKHLDGLGGLGRRGP
jgi:hypothetical protein